jgi:hypothetical protein
MLYNSTLTLLLGVTMLFTAVSGWLVLRLIGKVSELESARDYDALQRKAEISEKAIEIYEAIEKTMVEANKMHTDQISRLIDVMLGQLNAMDQRIEEIANRLVTKKSTTRRSKAPKEEMLKS